MRDYDLARWTVRNPKSVREVVEAINTHGFRTVFVVDEGGFLVAAVTDGDVRRALLAGHGLDSKASEAFNTDFVALRDGEDSTATRRAHPKTGPKDFPVVDPNGRLVSVETSPKNSVGLARENTVVVMAGGKGLRLRPLTDNTPKPLLEVGGKPILEHIIANLAREGFVNILVAVNYLGDHIEKHFGDGSEFGVRISYLREETELGTAGALSLLPDSVSLPLVVMNGDLVLGASVGKMLDYHEQKGAEITVGAKVIETTIPFGVLSTKGDTVTSLEEKPAYTDLVNAGVYVLNPHIVSSLLPNAPIDMPQIIMKHAPSGKVLAFPLYETWADLGRYSDLQNADRLLFGG